jgi:AraC family transcriptional regulator
VEERAWVERADRKMSFRVRRSSAARGWHGFEAYLYEASDGRSDTFVVDHSVSMHVGQPVLVTSRCDGAEVHRLQVPGDLKVIPAGYSRVWEIAAPTSKFVVDITPAFVREVAETMELGDRAALAPQLHLNDKRIEHVGWALLRELESDEPFGRVYAESLVWALTAQLLRRTAPAVARRSAGLPQRRLRRVLDYVRDNLAQNLSLRELASVAGVSPTHFKMQFRESMGVPVHRYVVTQRVETALDLLINTVLPISEVALHAGFYNQSHLSRHLQRLHGVSPAVLRRKAR